MTPPAAPARELTVFDTTSIIVGIIVGSAIFKSSPDIANFTLSVPAFLLAWVAGGLFAFIGSLCYAELATTYDEPGGDYVYLKHAFGKHAGFMFAWAQLWVVRPGATGAMAFVFREYAQQLAPLPGNWSMLYAAAPVVLLTAVNAAGVKAGKWTQNALTVAKVLGLLLVAGAGFAAPAIPDAAVHAAPEIAVAVDAAAPAPVANWGLTLVFILFAYGGWNDMAYVGAEVKNPKRNIWRSLFCGSAAVTLIYLIVNLAYLNALGFDGVRASKAIAAETARLALGDFGGTFVSVLVCISALGAIHGMLFTGSRIYYALGSNHRLFRPFASWHGAPVASLVLQGAVTLGVMLGFGLTSHDGFSRMVNYTVVGFWGFLCLTVMAALVLRFRDADRPRPFRAPALPLIVFVLCASCIYMTYSAIQYAASNGTQEVTWSLACLAVGGVVAAIDAMISRPPAH